MSLPHAARKLRREAVLAALREGGEVAEVARTYGISVSYVRVLSSEHCVEVVRRRLKSTIGLSSLRVIADLLRGMRQCDVARAHRVAPRYVSHLARRARLAGIPIPDETTHNTED